MKVVKSLLIIHMIGLDALIEKMEGFKKIMKNLFGQLFSEIYPKSNNSVTTQLMHVKESRKS